MLFLYNIFNIVIEKHIPITYSLFLFLFLENGNYIGGTLSCQIQKLFKNLIIKHMIVVFIIYFSIVFTKEGDYNNPTEDIFDAFKIWISSIYYLVKWI